MMKLGNELRMRCLISSTFLTHSVQYHQLDTKRVINLKDILRHVISMHEYGIRKAHLFALNRFQGNHKSGDKQIALSSTVNTWAWNKTGARFNGDTTIHIYWFHSMKVHSSDTL